MDWFLYDYGPCQKELNNSKSLIARGTDGLRRITMFGLGYRRYIDPACPKILAPDLISKKNAIQKI